MEKTNIETVLVYLVQKDGVLSMCKIVFSAFIELLIYRQIHALMELHTDTHTNMHK